MPHPQLISLSMSSKSLIAFSLFLLINPSIVMSEKLPQSDIHQNSILYKSLYRANKTQTKPILDPNNAFEKPAYDFISENDFREEYKNIDKCKKPSKAFFLSNLLNMDIDFEDCKEVKKFLNQTQNNEILFAYVSPNVRSPMSYFGHEFIVFNNYYSPFSRVISYSAIIPDGISYTNLMYKGAVGKLTGRYAFSPLHMISHEYLSIEQRNIIFYRLGFDEYENTLFRLLTYELYYTTFEYDFFYQNCASEMLQLIATIKPKIQEDLDPSSVTQPSEVIRTLKSNDIIKEPIIKYYSDIENLFFSAVALEDTNSSDITNYIENKKSSIYFKYFKNPPSDYIEQQKLMYDYEPFVTPLKQYQVSELPPQAISIGFNKNQDEKRILLSYSPGLIDKSETRFSYLNETTLKAINITLGINKDNMQVVKFDLIELTSLNKIPSDILLPSWGVYIGYTSEQGEYIEPEMLFKFNYGYSVGGLNSIFSLLPEYQYNYTENIYLFKINSIASLWSDFGKFTVKYSRDIYRSEYNKSSNAIFEYKSKFFNTSQIGVEVSNNRYVNIDVSYRF